jgi:hypothetical protein
MITMPWRRSLTAASAMLALATTVTAQSIADAVSKKSDGQVRFSFTLREGVCGYGSNISTYSRREGKPTMRNYGGRSSRDVEYDIDCEAGPGRVVLEVDRGEVTSMRFYVGGKWRPTSDANDLGMVNTQRAADYLIKLAQTSDGKPGREAVFPLTVIDSVTIWPALIKLARDDSRPRETRKNAVFWLGQAAEEPATRGLDELVGEAALDKEVRESAIFALSQRPKDEGVPALIRVVKTNKDPEMRKKALFWLGQSGDPRALNLIEELLSKE